MILGVWRQVHNSNLKMSHSILSDKYHFISDNVFFVFVLFIWTSYLVPISNIDLSAILILSELFNVSYLNLLSKYVQLLM